MDICNYNSPECVEYKNNKQACMNAGGTTQYDCIQLARDRYSRKTADFKNQVYPWKNYDWDYTRFVDNNYNSDATGATSDPTFEALFKNTGAMLKIAKGYITDPNPSSSARAAETDLTICSKVPAIDRASCEVMNNIRRSYNSQARPKMSTAKGFNNLPLDGKNSSSFYYQWGSCPTKDSKAECEKKGREWVGGKCYRPRYHYIKNEPGIDWTNLDDNTFTQLANQFGGIIQGNLPSVIGDTLGIFPTQLGSVWANKTKGSYVAENCDESTEHFVGNAGDATFRTVGAFFGLLLCIIVIIIYIRRIK